MFSKSEATVIGPAATTRISAFLGVLTKLILSSIIVCMLTTNDKKEIKQIVKKELKPVEDKLEVVRGAVVKIEKDRKVLWDIWDFIKDHTKQLKNHETRISNLESSPKN